MLWLPAPWGLGSGCQTLPHRKDPHPCSHAGRASPSVSVFSSHGDLWGSPDWDLSQIPTPRATRDPQAPPYSFVFLLPPALALRVLPGCGVSGLYAAAAHGTGEASPAGPGHPEELWAGQHCGLGLNGGPGCIDSMTVGAGWSRVPPARPSFCDLEQVPHSQFQVLICEGVHLTGLA